MEINLNIYDEVTSTNTVLKEMAQKGAPVGTVVAAWKQSEGKGRLGRSFCSPSGGVYLSMLLPFDDSLTLTAKAAVAVRRAIEYTTDIQCAIKWVNDIIYKGKKVCGILAQVVGDKIILGVGINLCTRSEDFPKELKDIAISLYKNSSCCDVDGVDVVNAVIREMIKILDEEKTSWLNEYRYWSVLSGQEVTVKQADQITGKGIVTCIDDNCALHVVDKNKGEMILSTGEVSVRLN